MRKTPLFLFLCTSLTIISCSHFGGKNADGTISMRSAQKLFNTHCASCHIGNGATTAPSLSHLGAMTPRSIVTSLSTGKMQIQGQLLSEEEKIAVAELLTQQTYKTTTNIVNRCEGEELSLSEVKYLGWGGDEKSSAYIPPEIAHLPKKDVPKLKLEWAFGFEGGTVSRSKPAVIDDYLIFGSQFGELYCLNMFTGCVQWMYQAEGMVRGGIAVSKNENGAISIYFADFNCKTYALNANTGKEIWKVNTRTEPANAVTGTVAYHEGMIYIPLTSMEVVSGTDPAYECCKGSGMVVALNAADGQEVWRHRVVTEAATPQEKSANGTMKYGPSGAPVWSSPTIDSKRGLLYIGTGENNSYPATETSDAIQALDLKTGELVWNFQATANDAYVIGKFNKEGTQMKPCVNCPDPTGPDLDFGMAPVMTTNEDGKDILIVGQKSGVVHCLDPDSGKPIWQKRIGRGGALGGIHWGITTDGKVAYVPNADWFPFGMDEQYEASPGLYAMDVKTGNILWKSTAPDNICKGAPGCYNANSAAPTLIDGVVFAGNLDGHARAYDVENGKVIWDFDTKQAFKTVNGVSAKGGSIDGPGPVIANGMVFFNSGYGMHSQMPGNVFLAFSIE